MKKILFTLTALVCAAATASAQDTIVKTDAQTIKAKILEISPSEVRYKRFSNPDGPTYVLPVADISHILYQNGERDDFNPAKTPAPVPAPAPAPVPAPAPAPVPAPAPQPEVCPEENPAPQVVAPVPQSTEQQPVQTSAPSAQTEQSAAPAARTVVRPEQGRVYDDNGVRGIVIEVDESGLHGLMLSLEESSSPRLLPWTTIRSPYPDTGATDKNDGAKNMEAVAAYIAANGLSWDDFPAFKWCRDLGDGWYLPSIDELLKVGYLYNGNQRTKFDRRARQQFNNTLKECNGAKLDPMANYYSSTYWGRGEAATSTMEFEPPYVQPLKAHERYLVRAVRKF